MHYQIGLLRNALAIAHVLKRQLVLPRMACLCGARPAPALTTAHASGGASICHVEMNAAHGLPVRCAPSPKSPQNNEHGARTRLSF
jgi:hypothetical protein